jgi:hypothetical protein
VLVERDSMMHKTALLVHLQYLMLLHLLVVVVVLVTQAALR